MLLDLYLSFDRHFVQNHCSVEHPEDAKKLCDQTWLVFDAL